jgi:hypothetical protein
MSIMNAYLLNKDGRPEISGTSAQAAAIQVITA